MTKRITMTLKQASTLEQAGIVTFQGVSGVKTDAVTAMQFPTICQMVSSAGDTFDLRGDGAYLVAEQA